MARNPVDFAFARPPYRLERRFGHRTVTHSFVALMLVAAAASVLYPYQPAWFWAVVGGYWSHLWIDMANIRGADLLWPSPVRLVFPGNRRYRLETGSKAEMVLFTALVAFALLLYPVSGVGFRVSLQHLLGNFEMAHDTFLKHAGSHWYTLKLEATDNLTLERINAECLVVGTWRQGLVVALDGELRAVGKSETAHNLYPTHAELIEGEPLRVISQRVDMRGRSLGWLLKRLDRDRTYFLSGELRVGGQLAEPLQDLDRFRPARFSGRTLTLHYAREAELRPYLGLTAAEGEVYVQTWLKPGDAAMRVTLEEDAAEEGLPAALAGYL